MDANAELINLRRVVERLSLELFMLKDRLDDSEVSLSYLRSRTLALDAIHASERLHSVALAEKEGELTNEDSL